MLSKESISILKYLNSLTNKNEFHNINTILELLVIPKKNQSKIIDELWFGHQRPLIDKDAKSSLIANIRLSPAGIDYVNINYPDMSTINETCELIFHAHKRGPIAWTKEDYKEFPRNASEALQIMERQGVLYFKNQQVGRSKLKTSRLEPIVMDANSYNEAIMLIDENKKAAQTSIGVFAPNNKGTIGQSSGNESSITQSVTIPPSKKNNAPKIIWYKTTLFKYIVFPLLVIFLSAAIFYIIRHIRWS
jgi:hypothetical protein